MDMSNLRCDTKRGAMDRAAWQGLYPLAVRVDDLSLDIRVVFSGCAAYRKRSTR